MGVFCFFSNKIIPFKVALIPQNPHHRGYPRIPTEKVNPITERQRENVILFPKTIDYYQIELTRLLETERYQEAMELLRFLLQCETGDPRADEEWGALLGWLETMSVSTESAIVEEDPDLSENDLLRMHLGAKKETDSGYVRSLLDTLSESTAPAKQILAVEQLGYIDHPDVGEALKRWLESASFNPLVQFKALQALKQRGAEGTLSVLRPGGRIEMEIGETPLSFSEFPQPLQDILHRVQLACQVNDPGLAYFAEEMWGEFLAFIYGTPTYRVLLSNEEKEIDIWAAALHLVLAETMTGSADERDTLERYGITSRDLPHWRQSCQVLRSFTSAAK